MTLDLVNYMGENTQPGVRAKGKATTEGILEALEEAQERQGGA